MQSSASPESNPWLKDAPSTRRFSAAKAPAEILSVHDFCPGCGGELDVSGFPPLSEIACPLCSEQFQVLKEIAEYTLSGVLGSGNFSDIYRAFDAGLQGDIALKVIRMEMAQSPGYSARLARLGSILASINHPQICQVFASGPESGLYCIAMELMPGGSLSELIGHRGRLPETEVLHLATQVIEGLKAAYSQGVLHGNMKPTNVLFTTDGQIKVSDFAIAPEAGEDELLPAEMRGIPFYSSPEKLTGRAEDLRSDIYSLGATLFHALTGRPPFPGQTAELVAQKHQEHRPPGLQSIVPEISSATSSIIAKMLEKSPAKRHQNYNELLEHLRFARTELGSKPRNPTIPLRKNSKPLNPTIPLRNPTIPLAALQQAPETLDRRKIYIASGVAAGVLALAIGGWVAFSKHRANSNETSGSPGEGEMRALFNPDNSNSQPAPLPPMASESPASNASSSPAAPAQSSTISEPDFHDAVSNLASGRATEARSLLDRLLNQSSLSKTTRCWALTVQGAARYADNKPDEALDAYRKLATAARLVDNQRLAGSFESLATAMTATNPPASTDAEKLTEPDVQRLAFLTMGLKEWVAGNADNAAYLLQRFWSADLSHAQEPWIANLAPVAGERMKQYVSLMAIAEKSKNLRTIPSADEVVKDFNAVTGPLAQRAHDMLDAFQQARAAGGKDIADISEIEVYQVVNRATGKCLTAPDTAGLLTTAAFKPGSLNQCWRLSKIVYGPALLCSALSTEIISQPKNHSGKEHPVSTSAYAEAASAATMRWTKIDNRYFTLAFDQDSRILTAVKGAKVGEPEVIATDEHTTPPELQQWELIPVPDAAKWAKQSDRIELEWMHVVDKSPDLYRAIVDAHFSGRVGTIMDAFKAGAYVTCVAPQVKAGKYEVIVGVKKMPTRSKFQVAIGPAHGKIENVGEEQDCYGDSSFVEFDLGEWSNAKTGDQWFKFTVTGANPKATGYLLGLDFIKLVPK